MALQFTGKSSGTTNADKARPWVQPEDDNDWNPKLDDVEVSSREVPIGTAVSDFQKDPVTDLKERLNSWGM